MTAARARFLLALTSAILLAGLAYLDHVYLSPDGLRAFDRMIFGYDLNHARAFIGALSPIENAVYRGPFRVLDTLFPMAVATFLALSLYHAIRHWNIISQVLLMVLPGAYLVMDLAENALVAQMLEAGVQELRAETVDLASRFTVTKYVLLSANLVTILAAHLVGRRR